MLRASATHARFFLQPFLPEKILLIIGDEATVSGIEIPTSNPPLTIGQGDLHALRVRSWQILLERQRALCR
jgi:hypothetical protein